MSATLLLCSNPTTIVKIIQNELQVVLKHNPDLYLVNQNNENIKIKDIREIKEKIIYPPSKHQLKTFILYNFEKTTIPAQNAFLKSLEEHPSYIQFILQCNNLNGVLETVQSRCLIKKSHKKNDENSSQDNKIDNENLSSIWLTISKSSYASIIELCSQYKNRVEAVRLTRNLLTYLHKKNQSKPNKLINKSIKNLSVCLQQLEQNSNVLLTLENHFFAIKSRF